MSRVLIWAETITDISVLRQVAYFLTLQMYLCNTQDASLIRTTVLRFVQVTWLEQWIEKAPVGTASSGCIGLSGLLMAWLWFLVSQF